MNKRGLIIALSGVPNSGKDTFARFLTEKHAFKRYAFADKVRESLYALNPIVKIEEMQGKSKVLHFVELSTLLSSYGWEEAKRKFPYIRELMQKMGTEVGRELFYDHFWTHFVYEKIADDSECDYEDIRAVITDLRFPNEKETITWFHSHVVKLIHVHINRPDVENNSIHSSELQYNLMTPDYTYNNDGNLEDLESSVTNLLELIENG